MKTFKKRRIYEHVEKSVCVGNFKEIVFLSNSQVSFPLCVDVHNAPRQEDM